MVRILKKDLKVGDYVKLEDSSNIYWYHANRNLGGRTRAITRICDTDIYVQGCENAFHWRDVVEVVTDPDVIAELGIVLGKTVPLGVALIKEQEDSGDVGTSSYGIRYKDSNDALYINEVCHATLRWDSNRDEADEITDIVNLVGQHYGEIVESDKKPKTVIAPIYRRYITWVLNESPWASICLTKDFDQACKEGVYLDVDRNISEIVAACIVMREGHEYMSRLPVFNAILDEGYSGNVAYLVAGTVVGACADETYRLTGMNTGHCVLSSGMGWSKLAEFFKTGYKPGMTGMRKDSDQTSFRIFDTIVSGTIRHGWTTPEGGDGGPSMHEVFIEKLNPETTGSSFYTKRVVTQDGVNKLADFITKELA